MHKLPHCLQSGVLQSAASCICTCLVSCTAGTAAVLLYVAYALYCWGSRISSEAEGTTEQQQQYSPTNGAWNADEFVEPNPFEDGVGDTGEVSHVSNSSRSQVVAMPEVGHLVTELEGCCLQHCWSRSASTLGEWSCCVSRQEPVLVN